MEKLTPLYGQVGLNTYYGTMRFDIDFFLDRTGFPPIITVLNVVRTPVYAYMMVLVAIGVILSLICLVFNIVFRKRK